MNEEYGYYLILLGGTGARCGEIFIHMCANGYFPGKCVNLLYIDSDLRNGNAERMRKLHENYQECRKKYVIKADPLAGLFRTDIRLMEENPVQGIEKFYDLAGIKQKNEEQMRATSALMRALYTDEEYEMQISEGFFSRPSVGSALFAANMESIMKECMARINEDQMAGKKIKIFMIGSVFGGTGASSLPTIARYIRKMLFGASKDKHIGEKLKIGASVVLPYFAFARKGGNTGNSSQNGIDVDARIFTTKTRTALEYYSYLEKKESSSLFDAMYLLGHDAYDVRGWYGTAGQEQKNLPHITEFYTAMAAVSFFGDGCDKGKYFAQLSQDKIDWNSFHDSERCVMSFSAMMRFAITMESLILEELFDREPWKNEEWRLSKHCKEIPWYYDFIEGRKALKNETVEAKGIADRFSDISEYCKRYVRWFAELFIMNLEKLDCPDQISFIERKSRKTRQGDVEENDLITYLNLFRMELVVKQYINNSLSAVFPVSYTVDKKENTYRDNLKFIRKEMRDLFDVTYVNQNGKKVEKVGFEEIWSRINVLGYNHMSTDKSPVRNMKGYTDLSLEEGVRNLINAIYIACLI